MWVLSKIAAGSHLSVNPFGALKPFECNMYYALLAPKLKLFSYFESLKKHV